MRVVAVFSHGRLRLLVAVLFVRLCVVVVVVGGCFRWVRGDVWCFLFPVCGEGWDLFLCRCRGRRRRRHLRLIRGRCLRELMRWRRGWRLHEELGDGVLGSLVGRVLALGGGVFVGHYAIYPGGIEY